MPDETKEILNSFTNYANFDDWYEENKDDLGWYSPPPHKEKPSSNTTIPSETNISQNLTASQQILDELKLEEIMAEQ